MSLDGFICGANNTAEQPMGNGGMRLHSWFFAAKTPADERIMNARVETTGAVIVGAKTYRDAIDGVWEKQNPFHAPAFVLIHEAPENAVEGFTYVTDGIDRALQQAQAVAGSKDVWVMGGAGTIQQFIAAGLVDEITLHIVPVLFGAGTRLFDYIGTQSAELLLVQVEQTPAALHLQYRVKK
jgi:dihydrofolate reductase